MRPDSSFINQPIRSLQTMLRVIAKNDNVHPTLVPDGIYGPQTVRAVSIFQRTHGIPVTGVTDNATWDAIWRSYEPALVEQAEAAGLHIMLNPGQVIRKGESCPHIYLVQAMLQIFCDKYCTVDAPSHSGTLDEATSNSLAAFQRLSDLPITGELDKQTWRHLVLQYPMAANRKNV